MRRSARSRGKRRRAGVCLSAAMRFGKSACVVLGWLVAVELAGCDNSAPSRRSQLEPQPATRPVSGADASDLSGVDPPALTGDLASEVEGFTTVDACVDRHARVDPLVGDALEAIGYDTLFRDACRILEAAKAKDSKRCLAIETSPLRERCLATVAELAGEPDACPWRFDSRKAL